MKLRKAERLDKFYTEKCRLHKKYFPDFRAGQLDSCFYGWLMGEKSKDLFFPEEDEMINLFREYCKEMAGEKFED